MQIPTEHQTDVELTTSTVEGTSSRPCKMVHGLTISTIDKKQQWKLPPIYAYNKLPQVINEVPTKQYIAPHKGMLPFIPVTTSIAERIMAFPTDSNSTSTNNNMAELKVHGVAASSLHKHVVCQPTYVNNTIYPKISEISNSSKIYGNVAPGIPQTMTSAETIFENGLQTAGNLESHGRALPIEQFSFDQDSGSRKSTTFSNTASSVAMELQSLRVTSETEISDQKSDIKRSNQIQEGGVRSVPHTLTEVVLSSGAFGQPSLLSELRSMAPFERSSENCYTLLTNARNDGNISLNSSTFNRLL